MTRVKTFDNTGIATSGRLYAGDLNLIQDQFADLVNLLQTHAVGTLQIGESGLQLLRYGAGEARLSGILRTDGILRALGGLYAGGFTSAQRDAIPAGSRPYGLVILNTINNRLEWNQGTDAAPSWQPISDIAGNVPIGTTIDWPWVHTQLPANYLLPYGQAVSRAAYPVLNAIASASGYPHGNGDGSTTFNLPDYRGRVPTGRDDMGTVAAGRITAGVSGINGNTLGAVGGFEGVNLNLNHITAHTHGSSALTVTGTPALAGAPALTGSVSNNTLYAGNNTLSVNNGSLAVNVGSLYLPNHGHYVSDSGHAHGVNDPAHTHSVYDPGHAHGVYDPGHNHAFHGDAALHPDWSNDGDPLQFQAGPHITLDYCYGIGMDPAVTGIGIYSSGTNISNYGNYTGISIAVNGTGISIGVPTSNPGILGSPGLSGSVALAGSVALGGTISNGNLTATIGSLSVNSNTLDVGGTTDSAGSGNAHLNVQPVIIVNRAMRVS